MSNETAIATLLEKGLGAYGQGELEKAVESWNRVLEMEPSNQTALDYLESAGFSVPYKDNVIELAEHRPTPNTSLADELKVLLKSQNYSEALRRLLAAKRDSPQDGSLGRAIRRVKDKYIVVLVRELGKLDQTVSLTTVRNVLEELNLSEDTRTVIDLIDGESSIGDIIHSSILEKHTTLRILVQLRTRGLIQLTSSGFSLPMDIAGSQGQEVMESLYPPDTPPPNFDALFRTATLAYINGDLETALETFEKCQMLRPDSEKVQHNIQRLKGTSQ